MSNDLKSDKVYTEWFAEIKGRYLLSQLKASVAVNSQRLAFNWSVGRDIVMLRFENTYGSRFYESLSKDLCDSIPESRGLSPTNLKYMRYFYELVNATLSGNRPQIVDDLGLANITLIKLSNLIPKNFRGSLPTIEEIEAELQQAERSADEQNCD